MFIFYDAGSLMMHLLRTSVSGKLCPTAERTRCLLWPKATCVWEERTNSLVQGSVLRCVTVQSHGVETQSYASSLGHENNTDRPPPRSFHKNVLPGRDQGTGRQVVIREGGCSWALVGLTGLGKSGHNRLPCWYLKASQILNQEP